MVDPLSGGTNAGGGGGAKLGGMPMTGATGGAMATGGTTMTGGTSATGGAGGTAMTGGTSATGGAGGTAKAGGAGGTTMTGGTSATGGAGGIAKTGGAGGTAKSGGAGGTAVTGGAGGTVAACPASISLDPGDDLLVNFEDGKGEMASTFKLPATAVGIWHTFNDATNGKLDLQFVPIAPARCSSGMAASVRGGPYTDWGAGIGFNFKNNDLTVAQNFSQYRGVRFFVRGKKSGDFRLEIRDAPNNNGGGCVRCLDYFGKDFAVTTEWKKIAIDFSSMTQRGFGNPPRTAVDSTQVLGIQFFLLANLSAEYEIDDVALYK
jgi:Carbohydrate binding domain (family 11)